MRATSDQLLVIGMTAGSGGDAASARHPQRHRQGDAGGLGEPEPCRGLRHQCRDHVIRVTWIIGAGLACIAGVMAGLLVQIRPYMGFDLLLPLFAAAILGGIGSIPGAMLGGLIIGLAEAFAVQIIGAEWRAAISFIILVLVLMLRPQGLFGQKEA
jgi:branched-chain amino acid transport system permease protein